MKILVIDEKWSIMFDSTQNDRPRWWLRYGERHRDWHGSNADLAMFYALLKARGPIE